jgi:tetratricopeptide (TPR) repeat protein
MNRHQRRANAKLQHRQAFTDPRIEDDLRVGVGHHQAGRFADAEACYHKVLAAHPNHADALHLLGVIAHRSGQLDKAAESIRLALRQSPQNHVFLANLGLVLRDQGKLDDAVAAQRKAIAVKPDYAEAHSNLAVALREQDKLDEAVAAGRQAIRIKPNFAEAYSNVGIALFRHGKIEDAIAAFAQALRISPEVALFHFNFGAALQERRDLDGAILAYGKAIAIDPNHAKAHSNLSAALRESGKLDEAVAASRRAIRLDPDFAEAHSNLGAALYDQGQLEAAAAAYRQAIRLNPRLDVPHGNLGTALIELGRLSEGRMALEHAVRLAPRNAKHRRGLGELHHFVVDDPQLIALEQLAKDRDRLAIENQIELQFALGKAYDDVGDHAKAFTHWRDGNGLKRQHVVYDEGATLGTLERIPQIFTAEFMQRWQHVGHPSSVPVFVLGMPRSGTTLVEQILASHPEMFGAGELKAFDRAMEGIRGTAVAPALFLETALGMTAADFRDLGARYLAETMQLAPAATHIIDKMPANFRVAGLIHLAFPNATIIHTVRDPADTCLSCYSKLFAERQFFTYDLAELGRYYRHYQNVMAHWHHVLPAERILDVRYEDLVADLEGQARRIIARCGLTWDPRCLAFYRTERSVRTASATQVRQPIYTTAIGRWRKYEPQLQPLLAELARLNQRSSALS